MAREPGDTKGLPWSVHPKLFVHILLITHPVTWLEDLPEGLAASGAVDIAKVLEEISGGRVLDVGTGSGDMISTLIATLNDYEEFIGIDIDDEKLGEARERLEGEPVRFLEMDGSAMVFPDRSFDTVCIANSLHHLEHLEGVMTEMLRVLRPGGTFILQEMFSDGQQSPAQRIHIAVHHWAGRLHTLLGTYHRRTYTREEIRSMVEALELREVVTFETARPVKCLFCEDRFECEDPLAPDIVRHEIEDIERDLERLVDCPDVEAAQALSEEAPALIDMLRRTGDHTASSLFFIGTK
jgi:ubiquinone/menaquinone biosynthesis C-methylase UbiE